MMFPTWKKQRSRIGWKIYFWFVAALSALKYISFFFDGSFCQYLTHPIPIVPLAGLYGYAYPKEIIGDVFWGNMAFPDFNYGSCVSHDRWKKNSITT